MQNENKKKAREAQVQEIVNELTRSFNELGELHDDIFDVKMVIVGLHNQTESFSSVGIQYHTLKRHHETGELVKDKHFMFCLRADDFTLGWDVYKKLAEDYGVTAEVDQQVEKHLANHTPINIETAIKLIA